MYTIRFETIEAFFFALACIPLGLWALLGGRPPALRYAGFGLLFLALLVWGLFSAFTWLVVREAARREGRGRLG